MDNNCIFCKIAQGEFDSFTIYEDDKFKVFLDKFPASKGHALIIPKKHQVDFFSLDEETASELFKLANRTSKILKDILGCDGMHILQNNGKAAWQSVFHYHLHLIPRYMNDGITFPWKANESTDEELSEIVDLFKKANI